VIPKIQVFSTINLCSAREVSIVKLEQACSIAKSAKAKAESKAINVAVS